MKKISLSLSAAIALLFTGNVLFAQSVEQGKKFLYYQRYKSAKDAFEKVLQANPNDLNAVYWLGQTLLAPKENRDTAGAKALYQKSLISNGTAPLILAGMGEIELLEDKPGDAKQHFETAISLTKGKDIEVLNAVGRANANFDVKAGDPNYAIEKLTMATQIKKFNDAETYVLMGDAYRKLIDGGNAVLNYTKALQIQPNFAEADYKIGKIYLSQNNREYFLPAFEKAVQEDPAYAPGYYELYYYWYYHDVNKAGQYLDKYVANTDQGPETEYSKADYLYASSKFADAKAKAEALISQYGDKVSPRMYRLLAFAEDTLGDPVSSKQSMLTYFSKETDSARIRGSFYELLAKDDGKSPDSLTQLEAFKYYGMAIQKDSMPESKSKYISEATALAKSTGNKLAQAQLAELVYTTKKNPTQTDLYNWGMGYYQAGRYKTSDSIFCGLYRSQYPDQIFGYLWCARSNHAQDDSTSSGGLAVDSYQKLAQFGRSSPDSAKFKSQIIEAYSYLAAYSNNIKKDKAAAIDYLNKILEVDPTNAQAKQFIEILNRKPAPRPKATK
ncbi:MAG TPA: tetratricopeptide repeat protein [Puia sp.]|nr:tetratricopeptide repeat protein [Puia sp.]